MSDSELKPFEDLKEIISNGAPQKKKIQMIGLSVAELGIQQLQFIKQHKSDMNSNWEEHKNIKVKIKSHEEDIKTHSEIIKEGRFIKKYGLLIGGGIMFILQIAIMYQNFFGGN